MKFFFVSWNTQESRRRPGIQSIGRERNGTENYGGPVVTKGGVPFIAATKDGKFPAFNKRTGKLLWETDLPASGVATPASYQVNGRQYLVIACGGGKLGTECGDSYVAFALPRNDHDKVVIARTPKADEAICELSIIHY